MHDITDANGGPKSDSIVPFGREMRKQFLFAETWRNMNHGSFGTYPRPLRTRLQDLHDEIEERPDVFIRSTFVEYLNVSRHTLARFVNAPRSTIVLVPNATTGINVVFNNLVFNPGDTILCFSTTYGACIKTLLWIAESTPATVKVVPLLDPAALSNAAILSAVEATVTQQRAEGLTPRALLLDTIVSQPGVRMPFEALVALCRRLGIYSVVDAAHHIGQLPLDLTALDPDFLVTNTHKWLFVPRACAVMYVPLRNQHLIRTSMPTSANFVPRVQPRGIYERATPGDANAAPEDATPFVKLFEYVGTLDSLPYLCVPAAMRFRDEVCGGEAKTQAYCAELARKGADRVAEMLGTEVLDNAEGTLRTGLAMAMVRLPLDPDKVLSLSNECSAAAETAAEAAAEAGAGAASAAAVAEEKPEQQSERQAHVANWLQMKFVEEHDSFVAIGWWAGGWWTRLSAQVYLELADFEWVGGVLGSLCERVRKGEHLKVG